MVATLLVLLLWALAVIVKAVKLTSRNTNLKTLKLNGYTIFLHR